MPIPILIAAGAIAAAAGIAAAAAGRAIAEGDYQRAADIYAEAEKEYGPEILPEMDKLIAQEVPPTELAKFREDASLRQAQMRGLRELENVYESEGTTAADEAAMRLANAQVSGRAGSDYQNINQMLARRGQVAGGAQAAAMYGQAGQNSALALGQMANESAIAARQRALQALEASTGMAGQIRGQDYGIARDRGMAQDAINQFNARMRDDTQRGNVDMAQREFMNELALRDRRNEARYRRAGNYDMRGDRTNETFGGIGQGLVSAGAGLVKAGG
jgi:hypothetical protein